MKPSKGDTLKPGIENVERHIVLIAPDVHWNTGNIGRTCLGSGAQLHLIEPLGFSLDDKEVKRAGLDYWHKVRLSVWNSFDSFMNVLSIKEKELIFFSKKGSKPFWDMPSGKRLFLVFGSETKGLPESMLERYRQSIYYIPITGDIRSLNLSTAAGIGIYESLRTAKMLHAWS